MAVICFDEPACKRIATPTLPRTSTWTTDDELSFIRQLGRHRTYQDVRSLPRPFLLRRYAETLTLRADWQQIDRQRILSEVHTLLQDGATP